MSRGYSDICLGYLCACLHVAVQSELSQAHNKLPFSPSFTRRAVLSVAAWGRAALGGDTNHTPWFTDEHSASLPRLSETAVPRPHVSCEGIRLRSATK